MPLQSGPVITSQGVLINSHMKQATVERAIWDHKWHSHIPHRDHITLCTVSVRWTPETAENLMRVFDPRSEWGRWALNCYQCITVSEMCTKRNPKQDGQSDCCRASSAKCCSASKGQQPGGRRINCFTWWTLCIGFSIPESYQPKLQTLWVRSPHSALAASLSIFSLCEEIQASATIWTLPPYLLAK